MMKIKARSMILTVGVIAFAGCTSAYYKVAEKFGYEKRDILVSRVKDARDDEQAAKKQFETTLQRFQDVTHFQGGDLEAEYDKLKADYDDCESRAGDVRKRIASVEQVASDLFKEWEQELDQYSDPKLRDSSQQKLIETRARYQKLIIVMKAAAKRMDPVLAAFKDQVLYLKHNLNAAAIASLQTTAAGVQSDVNKLIGDMEKSIAEANSFIDQMK
jgi:Skp family chaperone for outer membrane proteins